MPYQVPGARCMMYGVASLIHLHADTLHVWWCRWCVFLTGITSMHVIHGTVLANALHLMHTTGSITVSFCSTTWPSLSTAFLEAELFLSKTWLRVKQAYTHAWVGQARVGLRHAYQAVGTPLSSCSSARKDIFKRTQVMTHPCFYLHNVA